MSQLIPATLTETRRGVILSDASQSIPHDTMTTISWGTDVWDDEGWHASGSTEVIVPTGKGGRYSIAFYTKWTVDPSSSGISILINGSHFKSTTLLTTFYEYGVYNDAACKLLNEGDVLTFNVYHYGTSASRTTNSTLEIGYLGP